MARLALPGRTVLLTGATGGIGHAIARALRDRGAALVVSGRNAEQLERLRAELDCEAAPADLSDPAAVAALAERAGGVDALVANAALPASGPFDTFSGEEIDRALAVNLRAPIELARLLAPRMRARGAGHLVFVSSLSGKLATPGSAVYSATKFGLRGFAGGLREDLHGTGVGVTVVSPGFVSGAGMFAETGVELPRWTGTSTPEQVAQAVVRGIERGRAEIDVAPLSLRAGVVAGAVAPGLAARVARLLGSARYANEIAERQRAKR